MVHHLYQGSLEWQGWIPIISRERCMPIEIKVAPTSIVISKGRTFMVTNQSGEITPPGDEGVYASDTRFISVYRLYICRQPWELVNASQLSFYASRIHLTNPKVATEDGDLNEHTIRLTLERTVGEGIHEDYYIVNYAGKKIRIVLELALRSDFADIFEVKEKRFVQRGRVQSRWHEKEGQLRTTYTDNDFHRAVTYQLMNSDSPPCFPNGRISFEIELEPGQHWHHCRDIILEHGLHIKKPVYRPCTHQHLATDSTFAQGEMSDFDERQIRWLERSPDILTPNDHVYRMYRQAVGDMGPVRSDHLDLFDGGLGSPARGARCV